MLLLLSAQVHLPHKKYYQIGRILGDSGLGRKPSNNTYSDQNVNGGLFLIELIGQQQLIDKDLR